MTIIPKKLHGLQNQLKIQFFETFASEKKEMKLINFYCLKKELKKKITELSTTANLFQ